MRDEEEEKEEGGGGGGGGGGRGRREEEEEEEEEGTLLAFLNLKQKIKFRISCIHDIPTQSALLYLYQ